MSNSLRIAIRAKFSHGDHGGMFVNHNCVWRPLNHRLYSLCITDLSEHHRASLYIVFSMFPVISWQSLLSPYVFWAAAIWPAETGAWYEWGADIRTAICRMGSLCWGGGKHTLEFHHTHYLTPLPFSSFARVSIPTDFWKSEPSHSNNSSHERSSLCSHVPLVPYITLVFVSIWKLMERDWEVKDKGFVLFVFQISIDVRRLLRSFCVVFSNFLRALGYCCTSWLLSTFYACSLFSLSVLQ